MDATGQASSLWQASTKPTSSVTMSSKRRVLYPECGAKDVLVHRVARPDDGLLDLPHGDQERRQQLAHAVGSHAGDERQPARHPLGIETSQSATTSDGDAPGPSLTPIGLLDAREELHVRPVRIARPLPDPQQVGRARVPVAVERVAPGQPLLVVEQQALVARPGRRPGAAGARSRGSMPHAAMKRSRRSISVARRW